MYVESKESFFGEVCDVMTRNKQEKEKEIALSDVQQKLRSRF